MKLTLVRSATLLLDVGSRRILVDPMLRAAGTTPPIEGTPNPRRNPLVELPFPAEDVVAGLDGCLVTHLHGDHFDDAAAALLPRDLPIRTQPESTGQLRERGFTDVSDGSGQWLGTDVAMTRGHHGTGDLGAALGPVCGFVLDGVYIAGDTVWCDEVRFALTQHRPRAIVVNGGGARFDEGDPIVMTAADVRALRDATDARIVVVHLEAMNHCLERRDAFAAIDGVEVPADGETLDL